MRDTSLTSHDLLTLHEKVKIQKGMAKGEGGLTESRRGRQERESDEKRIQMFYVHVGSDSSHCNHYVLQKCTKKTHTKTKRKYATFPDYDYNKHLFFLSLLTQSQLFDRPRNRTTSGPDRGKGITRFLGLPIHSYCPGASEREIPELINLPKELWGGQMGRTWGNSDHFKYLYCQYKFQDFIFLWLKARCLTLNCVLHFCPG